MTAEEKLIKHIDMLIDTFNEIYKDYRNTENKNKKRRLCNGLICCAFGLAHDFDDMEKILSEVES